MKKTIRTITTMKTKTLLPIIVLAFLSLALTGCIKQEVCPVWDNESYNTVTSALCNFKETTSECKVKVSGWMYEEHASGEESMPLFYLADTNWQRGDKSVDQFMLVDARNYPEWDPTVYREKKLYITGEITHITYPENGHSSTSLCLYPISIDTLNS